MTTQNIEARLLLWSDFSKACQSLRSSLKPEQMELLKRNCKSICVDSEEIRQAILNAQNVKVNNVPCLIDVYTDGTIATYESEKCFHKLTELIQNFSTSPMAKQQAQQASQSGGLPVSSVASLLEGRDSTSPMLPGKQGRRPKEIKILPRTADLARGMTQIDAPPGFDQDSVPEESNMFTEEEEVLEQMHSNRPNRGEGHSRMVSSLPDVGGRGLGDAVEYEAEYETEQPIRQKKPFKQIQDVTPMEDDPIAASLAEDPSGMGIPRGDGIPIGNKSSSSSQPDREHQTMGGRGGQEKSAAIKNLASKMAAARQQEQEKIDEAKKGPPQQKRRSSKKEAIAI